MQYQYNNYNGIIYVEIINFDKYIKYIKLEKNFSSVCEYYKQNRFDEIVNMFFENINVIHTHKNKYLFLFKIAEKYNFLVKKYDVIQITICDCCKEKTKEMHLVLEFLEE